MITRVAKRDCNLIWKKAKSTEGNVNTHTKYCVEAGICATTGGIVFKRKSNYELRRKYSQWFDQQIILLATKRREQREILQKRVSGLNIFLTAFSDGLVLFQLSLRNNNSATFSHYLVSLVTFLDKNRSGWQANHVLLLDNMAAHKSAQTNNLI